MNEIIEIIDILEDISIYAEKLAPTLSDKNLDEAASILYDLNNILKQKLGHLKKKDGNWTI